ncbi:MAG: mannose-6-phosphate isomerase, class I [Chitinophagaceae bacterium]|nr:MAG: mannose-6-phosphate isomerase, class I [Chitinophagaceae bacterium]
MKRVYKLKGVVQHYNWGGTSFIPQLLAIANTAEKPFAEYWLGAHPAAPSMIEEENVSLDQFVGRNAAKVLGEEVAQKFPSLPYLFKILDVAQMLSIQVHPSKASAEEEFERENEKGIPLNAPHRNYKDKNHKPELMVALSDFWLLHGFKSEAVLKSVLEKVPELRFLTSTFGEGNYQALYEEVMTMKQEKVNEVLSPLLRRIVPAYENNELKKSSEDFWAARAAVTFCKDDDYDRGIFSIYFFNLIHLREGEAIYQAAGLPHAYLEGQNVEVMANSDNVLRAGLTEKHVDVPELMKHVKFEATYPNIILASSKAEQKFDAPVEEFQLKRYLVDEPIALAPRTATIVFITEGEGTITAEGDKLTLSQGQAALLLPGESMTLEPLRGGLTAFAVSTPLDKN